MSKYNPSVFTVLEDQKSMKVFLALGASFMTSIIVVLINVSIFYFVLNAVGFWYTVAIFSFIRILTFYLGEYSKYRMEQEIMKGGK